MASLSSVFLLMLFGPDLCLCLILVQSSDAFTHLAQGDKPSHRTLRTEQASHTRRWLIIFAVSPERHAQIILLVVSRVIAGE